MCHCADLLCAVTVQRMNNFLMQNTEDCIRIAPNMTKTKLPLSPDFFRCPPLSRREEDYFRKLARESLKELVKHAKMHQSTDMSMVWRAAENEGNIQFYEGEDPMSKYNLSCICGVTEIEATIDEVSKLFRYDTAEEFVQYSERLEPDILDMKTLYTFARPSQRAPRHYIGVKWVAIESPTTLFKNRDFCYLEVIFLQYSSSTNQLTKSVVFF